MPESKREGHMMPEIGRSRAKATIHVAHPLVTTRVQYSTVHHTPPPLVPYSIQVHMGKTPMWEWTIHHGGAPYIVMNRPTWRPNYKRGSLMGTLI